VWGGGVLISVDGCERFCGLWWAGFCFFGGWKLLFFSSSSDEVFSGGFFLVDCVYVGSGLALAGVLGVGLLFGNFFSTCGVSVLNLVPIYAFGDGPFHMHFVSYTVLGAGFGYGCFLGSCLNCV